MVTANLKTTQTLREQIKTLQDKENVYSLAVVAGGVGIWEWHPQTGAFLAHPMLLTMFGYEKQRLVTSIREWISHVHPFDRPAVECALVDFLKGNTNNNYEHRHRVVQADRTARRC